MTIVENGIIYSVRKELHYGVWHYYRTPIGFEEKEDKPKKKTKKKVEKD